MLAELRPSLAPVLPAVARAYALPRTLPGVAGVALTFDDGPHPEGTPMILEVLAREGERATFFLVGEQVRRRPGLAAEIVAAGHAVALHGDRHRLQLRLSANAVCEDLARGVEAVATATGVAPTLHRPPYGIYSLAGLTAARTAGLRPLLWSRWGKDWRKFTTPARIAARAARDLERGDVILLHDADFYSSHHSHRRTAAALPVIIAEIRRRGLGTVLAV
ncbi:MAG TPA: polysaccharide deacetylase family protein [Thermoleophilia bacterium]|nr:polysaccharide deacetylase family protein [Thermoleophilia bacterium]